MLGGTDMAGALAAIEAAYDTGEEDADWLSGVLEAAAPNLDRGLGMIAYLYDASDVRHLRVSAPAEVGALPSGWREAWMTYMAATAADEGHTRRLYLEGPPVTTVSERLGMEPERRAEYREGADLGMRDFLGVVASDPTGIGCVLCVNLAQARRPTPDETRVWSRVAA